MFWFALPTFFICGTFVVALVNRGEVAADDEATRTKMTEQLEILRQEARGRRAAGCRQ